MQMSLICFVFFFSLPWFFRQIICMMLYSFHTSPFEALIDKKLTITDWDIMMSKFEKRDRQAIQVQKRKPNKIVWHLLNIVVYTNSKKKILTMATVYKTGICLHALHVNTFWAVRLHLITIGRIMHENGKLTMTFSFWWYLNVQGILFISYTMSCIKHTINLWMKGILTEPFNIFESEYTYM